MPPTCSLVKSFVARQGIIIFAAFIFIAYVAVRVSLGHDKRNLQTFLSDASKQGGQQLMGGALLVLMGLHLSERGLSPLAWYGAQYPFEIVITTVFTGLFRQLIERSAVVLYEWKAWGWLEPYTSIGKYGPNQDEWRWDWYFHQLAQAILLIGLPARVVALGSIMVSVTLLPEAFSPVVVLGDAWYSSGLTCNQQTVAILYVLPLAGDAMQFIIIDRLQAFGFLKTQGTREVTGSASDSEALTVLR